MSNPFGPDFKVKAVDYGSYAVVNFRPRLLRPWMLAAVSAVAGLTGLGVGLGWWIWG